MTRIAVLRRDMKMPRQDTRPGRTRRFLYNFAVGISAAGRLVATRPGPSARRIHNRRHRYHSRNLHRRIRSRRYHNRRRSTWGC